MHHTELVVIVHSNPLKKKKSDMPEEQRKV
jgi:hypothetical protein